MIGILHQHKILFDKDGYWVVGVAHVCYAMAPEVLEEIRDMVLEDLDHECHLFAFFGGWIVWYAVIMLGETL